MERRWLLFEWGEYVTESDDGERLDGAGFRLLDRDGRAVGWDDASLAGSGVFVFSVAGVSYRLDVAQSETFAPGRPLSLVRDPENEFDANAIGVWDEAQREQVGFVPADKAVEIGGRLAGERLAAVSLWEWRKDGQRCALRVLVGPPAVVDRVRRSADRRRAEM